MVVPNTIPLHDSCRLQRVLQSLNGVSGFVGFVETESGIQQIDADQDDHKQAFASE